MTNEMISTNFIVFLRVFYFFTLLSNIASVVPPDYCFYQLNTSDCNEKPTQVFSYYKPGSRCDLDIWRGCPTYNKFDNEFECSNTCIYRFNVDSSENFIKFIAKPDKIKLLPDTEYFEDLGTNMSDWEDELNRIPEGDIVKLHRVLNQVLNETNTSIPIVENTDAPQTTPEISESSVDDITEKTMTEIIITTGKELQSTVETPTARTETTMATTPTTIATTSADSSKENVVITTANIVTPDNEGIKRNVLSTDSISTTDGYITTESVITTDGLITTGGVSTTDSVITTDSKITTETIITKREVTMTTEPVKEPKTTMLNKKLTTKGEPDEVVIM